MRTLLVFFGVCMFVQVSAQIDFGDPELDDNILNSKQHKRLIDYASRRNTNGLNGDWHKWQVWQSENQAFKTALEMQPWQNYGPDTVSGRIISISFHPTDTNTMLVGASSGGLWRTNDYGSNWEVLTDEFFTMDIGAVSYNPLNPNSILIATGEGYGFGGEFTAGYGIMISHDGGNTWQTTSVTAEQGQSFAGMDIHWNADDTTKVCVATSFSMYYSSDGGMTYAPVLDRLGGRMIADPQNPDRLYFTARYYNANYPGGLYISDNSGASWLLVSGSGLPVPENFGFASIAIHPTHNNIVYVSISQSPPMGSGPLEGLYHSTDFGVHFAEVPAQTDYFCYHPPYEYICLGWYANTIAISPTDTNRLYAGGTHLWTSADGGIT